MLKLFLIYRKKKAILKRLQKIFLLRTSLVEVNDDMSVNIKCKLSLDYKNLSKVGIFFNQIDGDFSARCCNITDNEMKYLPKIIKGSCDLTFNKITTLENGPTYIEENLKLAFNPIKEYDNQLTSCKKIWLQQDNENNGDMTEYTLAQWNALNFKNRMVELSKQLKDTIPEKQKIKKGKI